MRNYSEIKQLLLNFNINNPTREEQNTLKEIATQLSFTYNDCGCKSMYGELYRKLTNWLKNHKELCHYKMAGGVLVYLSDGTLCTTTNITDELAKRMIEEGKDKFLKQILPFEEEKTDNESAEVITAEEVTVLEEKSVKTVKSSGKRTVKSEKKITKSSK